MNTTRYDGLKKPIKVVGLMAIIAYIVVILYVWISSDLRGYTYFTAGEPNGTLRYAEWFLGIVGVVIASSYLKKELDPWHDS